MLDAVQCYRALRSRDARFDGRFFIGVRSTGVYCRPVCPVKPPLARNCRYFPSAAAAEVAGFRPCLRCRPELAPGFAAVDANHRLAQAAARLITDGELEDGGLEGLAARLSVTDRHLRRVFRDELGVSPVEYAQTQRLLLAKRLLTDTDMTVVQVALASGFGSLRRFNDLFRTRYRMKPTDLRRTRTSRSDRLVFDLAYRPPYDWSAMLAFFARRAIAGVEHVDGACYRRTLRVGALAGWIEVRPAPRRDALRVLVSDSFAPSLPALLSRVKALFDLSCNPHEIGEALGPLAIDHPGLRLPGAVDGFEIAVRAVLGQQVTVKAAATIAARFVRALGEPCATPHAELTRVFPRPEAIARASQDDIARHGILAARARAILAIARAIAEGKLALDPSADIEATLAALAEVPGVGPWTAQYIVMRALGWPDAFPHPDVGVLKAMRAQSPRAALATAEGWRPFRGYAVVHLWKSLERSL